jgi:hypothetical protein
VLSPVPRERSKNLIIPFAVSALSLVSALAFAAPEPSTPVSRAASDIQHPSLLKWAAARLEKIKGVDPKSHIKDDWHYNQPVFIPENSHPIADASPEEKARNAKSVDLYFKLVGRDSVDSIMWTGVESGNPLTRFEDYRWDSLEEQGLYDPNFRAKMLDSLKRVGIRNSRLGLSNHTIDLEKPETWKRSDDIVSDFAKAGIRISMDLHHFGIEDRFRVAGPDGRTIGEKSYYLNPEWPDYFAKYSREVVRRYGKQIKAITIMNEPETVIGFNGEMWHGGFPGWSHPQANRYYIKRALQVGKASVKARLAIEGYLASLPVDQRPEFFYMHTEAAVYKSYWEDFNLYRRFVISDMILGDDWLLNADLNWLEHAPMEEFIGRWHRLTPQQRTVLDWVIENQLVYNQRPEDREALRTELVADLRELKGYHEKLRHDFNKTMKTDTVLGVDYYAHNEDRGRDGVTKLSPKPNYYHQEIKKGDRGGIVEVMAGYYNHYRLPLMIAETGTPYWAYFARWMQQMLLAGAEIARKGVPFLGVTAYPLNDTDGWESALSIPKNAGVLHNPSGLLQRAVEEKDPIKKAELDFTPRPSVFRLIEEMSTVIPLKATVTADSKTELTPNTSIESAKSSASTVHFLTARSARKSLGASTCSAAILSGGK